MDKDPSLENDMPRATPSLFSNENALTLDEKQFILQVLQSMKMGGTYAELVPTMNIVESILAKLSAV